MKKMIRAMPEAALDIFVKPKIPAIKATTIKMMVQ